MLTRNELLINITDPNRVFFSGDIIKGSIELRNPAPINIAQLSLSLKGQEATKVYHTTSSSIETNIFLNLEKILDGSKIKKAGSHTYPFEIILPELLPPTFENDPNATGKIWYTITAKLEPLDSTTMTTLQTSLDLVVGGSLFSQVESFICPLIVQESKELSNGSINATVKIHSKVFKAGGDTIFINVELTNQSNEPVSVVNARLLQIIEYYSCDILVNKEVLELSKTAFGGVDVQSKMSASKSLKVPKDTVETIFLKHIPRKCTFGKLIRISYAIEVTAIVNLNVEPLTINLPILLIKKNVHGIQDESIIEESNIEGIEDDILEDSNQITFITPKRETKDQNTQTPEHKITQTDSDTSDSESEEEENFGQLRTLANKKPSIVKELPIPAKQSTHLLQNVNITSPRYNPPTSPAKILKTERKGINTSPTTKGILPSLHSPRLTQSPPISQDSPQNISPIDAKSPNLPSLETIYTLKPESSPLNKEFMKELPKRESYGTPEILEKKFNKLEIDEKEEEVEDRKETQEKEELIEQEEKKVKEEDEERKEEKDIKMDDATKEVEEKQSDVSESEEEEVEKDTTKEEEKQEEVQKKDDEKKEMEEKKEDEEPKEEKKKDETKKTDSPSKATQTSETQTPMKSVTEKVERIYPDGGKYFGYVKDGKRHGQGIYFYPNGSKYNGSWENDKKHGKGIMTYADGSTYSGDWKDGYRHGWGVYSTKQYTYDGQWKYNAKQGYGLILYANGEQYEGEWVSNYPDGKGEYIFKDHSKYVGTFSKGLRNGRGVLTYGDGFTIYDGEWLNDRKHGKAKIQFVNGEYEGEMKDDMKEGKGVYKYHNGDEYNGEWHRNKKHGFGIYYYAEGGYYKGTWENGVKHGPGISVTVDDKKFNELWSKGKRIKKVRISDSK